LTSSIKVDSGDLRDTTEKLSRTTVTLLESDMFKLEQIIEHFNVKSPSKGIAFAIRVCHKAMINGLINTATER